MNKVLYTTPADLLKNSGSVRIVTKTTRGIAVTIRSLRGVGEVTRFYRDGHYPPLPQNWSAQSYGNDFTAAGQFFFSRDWGKPYRTVTKRSY